MPPVSDFFQSLQSNAERVLKHVTLCVRCDMNVMLIVEFYVTQLTAARCPDEDCGDAELIYYHPSEWSGLGWVGRNGGWPMEPLCAQSRVRFHLETDADGKIDGGYLQLLDRQPAGSASDEPDR